MRTLVTLLLAAAAASALSLPHLHAQGFASLVVDYQPGTGYVTDWQTGAGYTNLAAALGPPSQVTVDPDPQFGGTFPVDPFAPPYLPTQLLSIGQGGSVTLALGQPARDDPGHLYGIDFIVFGSAGFVITNGDFTGGGVTDGSLLGAQSGMTRVEVSADGVVFYELAPLLAPVFDGYLPTDGAGDVFRAANPRLGEPDFNRRDLGAIRGLYAGSAGGTGYDLAWARDAQGNRVQLDQASQVRLSVLSGHAEVDAVVVVPAASPLPAQGFDEDFAQAPASPWVVFGDAALFAWDPAAQALQVTWDSRRPNSYFARPLGTALNRHDDFVLGFTLVLDHVEVGVNPGKPYAFELAVGFLNWRDATNPGFLRGTGAASPNLVEFDYFPDSGYGATVWPTFVGRDGRWNYNGSEDFTLLELEAGVRHRVELRYTAADQTLRTRVWTNGAAAGSVKDVRLAPRFTDYAVDTFAVCSYSDQGAQGSLLARGVVDDITVQVPPPPVGAVTGQFVGGEWQVRFEARTNWLYVLERNMGWGPWAAVATNALAQANGPLVLTDLATFDHGLYRVRAEKP